MIQYRNIRVLFGVLSLFIVFHGFVLMGSEHCVSHDEAQLLVLFASQGRPKDIQLKPRSTRRAGIAARRLMQAMAANEELGSSQIQPKRLSRAGSRESVCFLCGAVFLSRSGLSRHRKSKHGHGQHPRQEDEARRLYRCVHWNAGCRYSSYIKSNVNRHIQRHQRARRAFLCGHPGCWKPFDTAKQLKAHVARLHHGLRVDQ